MPLQEYYDASWDSYYWYFWYEDGYNDVWQLFKPTANHSISSVDLLVTLDGDNYLEPEWINFPISSVNVVADTYYALVVSGGVIDEDEEGDYQHPFGTCTVSIQSTVYVPADPELELPESWVPTGTILGSGDKVLTGNWLDPIVADATPTDIGGEGNTDGTIEEGREYKRGYVGSGYSTLNYRIYSGVVSISIETQAAKSITSLSAIVGGKYTGTTTVEAGVSWRRQGVGMWNTRWWAMSPYSIHRDTTFWFSLAGLGPGLTYEFKAFYKIGTEYTYGSTLTFTTLIIPAVFVYPAIEYRTAKQAIDDVVKVGVGRYYSDHQGNFQYESRLRRNA